MNNIIGILLNHSFVRKYKKQTVSSEDIDLTINSA